MAVQRFEKNVRRSRVSVHGNTVYLAGQVADDVSLDIVGQTKQALANVDKMLALAGTNKSHIMSVTIWIKSMADVAKMNEVWDGWIDKESPPSRACAAVELARPEVKVEFIVIAAKP